MNKNTYKLITTRSLHARVDLERAIHHTTLRICQFTRLNENIEGDINLLLQTLEDTIYIFPSFKRFISLHLLYFHLRAKMRVAFQLYLFFLISFLFFLTYPITHLVTRHLPVETASYAYTPR